MAEDAQAPRDDLGAEIALWETLRDVYAAKGVDLEAFLSRLALAESPPLSEHGAGRDFATLCDKGCHAWVLAGLLALLRNQEALKTFWTQVVGPPRERDVTVATLNQAADTVEGLFALPAAGAASFAQLGRISPARLGAELRLYGRVLNLAALWSADMNIRSLDQFLMLTLASYVKRTTGSPQHAAIAGLLSETSPDRNYNEDAQKQWFYRNRALLEDDSTPVLGLAAMLAGFSQILPRNG
jgi:hypothetical protein